MVRRHNTVLGAVVILVGLLARNAPTSAAEASRYHFKDGERAVYRLVIRAQEPGKETMLTGYLMYSTKSSDLALGQITLHYNWDLYVGTTTSNGVTHGGVPRVPPFLAKTFMDDDLAAPEIVIDARGGTISFTGSGEQAQLEYALGPAWQIMLQPLPPEGQTTWVTNNKMNLRYYILPRGPGGFPIDEKHTVAVVPAEETITYTAKPPVDDQVVVERKYELKTPEGAVSEQTAGEGSYCFDGKAGFTKTLHLRFRSDHKENGISYSTAYTLDATLVTGSELAKLQSEAAISKAAEDRDKAREAKKRALEDAQEEKKRAAEDVQEEKKRAAEEALRADQLTQIPDGMQESELLGTEHGSEFRMLSRRHLPVIGFRIETGDWGGSKRFRSLDPLFDQKVEHIDGRTEVMAVTVRRTTSGMVW